MNDRRDINTPGPTDRTLDDLDTMLTPWSDSGRGLPASTPRLSVPLPRRADRTGAVVARWWPRRLKWIAWIWIGGTVFIIATDPAALTSRAIIEASLVLTIHVVWVFAYYLHTLRVWDDDYNVPFSVLSAAQQRVGMSLQWVVSFTVTLITVWGLFAVSGGNHDLTTMSRVMPHALAPLAPIARGLASVSLGVWLGLLAVGHMIGVVGVTRMAWHHVAS
ncbi:hypothetical protein [Sulfobacillus sp. hq2]|uniref:hypothetical protein n=1 Tax=Sulfobacillus TaxID=28033 RepID=UPI000CD32973|nr:hypothetical protein [Sulfobacillus sp. hq2]POB12314.1 hypothetical protein CO251_00155 [Sulfobacillus sp. hq2]